ncbi:MAG: MATE family efflux transporter [Succinivibrio sp.]
MFTLTRAYKKEFKTQLRLFVPFLFGQICATAMGTVDTVMAGLAGTPDISGVAIGCAFYWPAYLFIAGMAYAVTPTVSHLLAGRNYALMQKNLFNALIVCLVFGTAVAILLGLSPLVFNFLPSDPLMIEVARKYLFFVALSLPTTVIFNVYKSYAEGLGYTKPTMILGILMLLVNIPLNYIFIFGKFGMPAMGGAGCGMTSCFICVIFSLAMFLYVKKGAFFKQFEVKEKTNILDKEICSHFIKLSFPIGLSRTIEVACFSLAALLLSPFGPTVVAAHSITLNVSGLIFMIPLCMHMTATIRSAYAMGSRNWARAYLSLKTSMSMNIAMLAVYAALIFVFREQIASIYSNDPEVISMAVCLMVLNCIYMFPDAMQCLLLGVLQGFKDSRLIFINTIFSYWIVGMPIGIILSWGIIGRKMEAYGIWIGFICALTSSFIILSARVIYIFKNRHYPLLLAQSYLKKTE